MPFPQARDEAGWDALCADDTALGAGVAAFCARHGLDGRAPLRYASGSLPVYAIGREHVLKLFPPPEGDFASIEARSLATVHGRLPIPTPRLIAAESLAGWHGVLMSQLPGRRSVDAWPGLTQSERDGLADQLGASVKALHSIDTQVLADFRPRWHEFVPMQHAGAVERQRAHRLDPAWLDRIAAFLDRWMPPVDDRRVLLHTELMREHLLVPDDGSTCRFTGLFDFEPAMLGAPEYEFASLGLFVACGDGRFLRRVLLAYGYRPDELDAALQCRLMAHAMLHRYSNLNWYLERLPADGATRFEELAARWWPLA